jgi:hypothetical protein
VRNTTSQHVFLDHKGARAASVFSDGSHALGREHKITVGEQRLCQFVHSAKHTFIVAQLVSQSALL